MADPYDIRGTWKFQGRNEPERPMNTEIPALAARDLIGDDIVQLLRLIVESSREKGNGMSSTPSGYLADAQRLLRSWDQHNRDFEAALRQKAAP